MKKTIIFVLVLAVSLTAFSVCSVSAEDGAFYSFRPNLDFDTVNASYLYQIGTSGTSADYVFGLMNNTNQIFNYYDIEPADYDGDFATFEFYPRSSGANTLTGLVLPLGLSTLSADGSSVLISVEDTLFLESGRFYVQIETSLDAIIKARFTIRPVYNTLPNGNSTFSSVYATTDYIDVTISGSKSYFDYPMLNFASTGYFEDGVVTPVFLCVEFVFSTAEPLDITILNVEATTARLFYGSGTSPNNPIYPPADGGNVGNLDSAEQELIGSQQQGLDNTGAVIGNAENVILDLNTDLHLGAFVQALNPILDKIVTISGFDALVNMSLALGIFASLLSLSASIIGASDRKERMRKQRENRKNSNS